MLGKQLHMTLKGDTKPSPTKWTYCGYWTTTNDSVLQGDPLKEVGEVFVFFRFFKKGTAIQK